MPRASDEENKGLNQLANSLFYICESTPYFISLVPLGLIAFAR